MSDGNIRIFNHYQHISLIYKRAFALSEPMNVEEYCNQLCISCFTGEIDELKRLLQLVFTCSHTLNKVVIGSIIQCPEWWKQNYKWWRFNDMHQLGVTPLTIAVAKGHVNNVVMLLQHEKIDVNQKTNDGLSPLHIAMLTNNEICFRLLLEHTEIDVNAKANENFGSLLHVASQHPISDNIFRMLLNQDGLEINPTNKNRWTPMGFAICHRQVAKVMLFLSRGVGAGNVDWFGGREFVGNRIAGKIAVYKHALTFQLQPGHQQLLDFHKCRIHSFNNTSLVQSPLIVFKTTWPQLVSERIENFLLPTKTIRNTMNQVVRKFPEILNDRDLGATPVFNCIDSSYIEDLYYLLKQPNIEVNKLSQHRENEGTPTARNVYMTPLSYAIRSHEEGNSIVKAEIITLLQAAGGLEDETYERPESGNDHDSEWMDYYTSDEDDFEYDY